MAVSPIRSYASNNSSAQPSARVSSRQESGKSSSGDSSLQFSTSNNSIVKVSSRSDDTNRSPNSHFAHVPRPSSIIISCNSVDGSPRSTGFSRTGSGVMNRNDSLISRGESAKTNGISYRVCSSHHRLLIICPLYAARQHGH